MIDITTPELLAALLATFEGERLIAYQDSGGVWTIGFGHTGRDVAEGLVWSRQQAIDALARDSAPLLAAVASLPALEAAALASFGYNCGIHALWAVLNGFDTLSDPRHTKDRKGNVLPGLVARRNLEQLLATLSQQLSQKS